MRQQDNLPAFCRVHGNGRALIGQIRTASRTDRPDQVPRPVIKRRTVTRAERRYLKSPQVMPGRRTFLRRGHVSAATTLTKLSMRSDTASRLTAGTVTRDGSLLSVTIS